MIRHLAIVLLISLPLGLDCHAQPPEVDAIGRLDRPHSRPQVRPLIKANELQRIVGSPGLRILDMGPERTLFEESHLPTAQYVDWIADITDPKHPERYNVIDKQTMESLLRRLGIDESSHIVIYDDLDCRLAARMYWTLRLYGHRKVQLLDGGLSAWTREKHDTTRKLTDFPATEYRLANADASMIADMADVKRSLERVQTRLLDGRPTSQYSGKEPGIVFHTGTAHRRRGHIPAAVNVPWKANLRDDGCFRSQRELARLYLPLRGKGRVVTYCNEGLHAAMPWFVLHELLGVKDVALYDSSMSEWANSNAPMSLSFEAASPL